MSARVVAWVGAWISVLALAAWLSQLSPMWLVVAAVGSTTWTGAAMRGRRIGHLVVSAFLWFAIVMAVAVQVRLDRIANAWPELQPAIEEPLAESLGLALDQLLVRGEQAAAGAAEAAETFASAAEEAALFTELDGLRQASGVTAIALFDETGTSFAWAGEHRGTIPEAARLGTQSYLYQEGPLFSYLYFVRPLPSGITATAAFLLEAAVDPGEGVTPFADRFSQRHGIRPRFWTPDRERPESIWDWATTEGPIFSVTFVSLNQQDWWLRAADLGRRTTGLLLLAAFGALCIAWYRLRGEASGLPLVIGTASALIAPLDRLVGAEDLFSPLQFVLPGPVDVTLGALLILLAGGSIWMLARTSDRARAVLPTEGGAALMVLLFPVVVLIVSRSASGGLLAGVGAGGFALRLTTTLLLTVPLFLILRHSRPLRVPEHTRPIIRVLGYALPVLFGIGILLVWRPDRPIPAIVAALWSIPAVLLIGSGGPGGRLRISLRQWLVAGWLASTAAITFLWPMHMQAELTRAEREIALLGTKPDPFLDFLLRQFAESAARLVEEGEGGVNLLYHSWVASSLAREGYEARIGLWRDGARVAELNLSELPPVDRLVSAEVADVRSTPAVTHRGGQSGVHYSLVAPLPDGSTVTVVIPPRRQLGGATPIARFIQPGQERPVGLRGETLSLVPAGDETAASEDPATLARPDTVQWVRTDEGWRSETLVEMPEGPVHAHLVVRVTSFPLLMVRAMLLTTLLSAILAGTWLLARALCRDFAIRPVLHTRWLGSFRGRLSVALFLFVLLPTIGFGAISYGAVAREVLRSATALAQQALNQAAARVPAEGLGESAIQGGPDLLLYSSGTLAAATAPEFLELGLFDTWLPPELYLPFRQGEELQALEEVSVADGRYLVAYRRIDGGRTLAAPIPLASNEITRRQAEFRDVALFVILVGLTLSVVLALVVGRALSRPLEELRRAAITVGSGDLATRLSERRRDEFGSVYHSFNEMIGRLDQTRAALLRETRRTETIVAEAATGVLAIDASGHVELINPRAAEILGGAVGIGDRLTGARENGVVSSAVSTLLNSPSPEATTELELDGRTVRMRMRRLSSDGIGLSAVIALEDVTAEVRTARVLAWGEMARQVAHEIKNPLTPIKLAVQHLRRTYHDRRSDFPEILDRNVDSILEEIDRLSDISRAFSRFGTPADTGMPLEEVDVTRAVREVLALYRASDSGASFRYEIPDIAFPAVIARTGELKEVLVNLLENAREAVDADGEVVVEVAFDRRDGRVYVEVRDDGIGIPPDQLESIFEPHFSTQSSGTGLGLAIVRRIVESWGAEIVAESEPGKGSRFTIRLRPVALERDPA